jgi:hypothetical protein
MMLVVNKRVFETIEEQPNNILSPIHKNYIA